MPSRRLSLLNNCSRIASWGSCHVLRLIKCKHSQVRVTDTSSCQCDDLQLWGWARRSASAMCTQIRFHTPEHASAVQYPMNVSITSWLHRTSTGSSLPSMGHSELKHGQARCYRHNAEMVVQDAYKRSTAHQRLLRRFGRLQILAEGRIWNPEVMWPQHHGQQSVVCVVVAFHAGRK